MPTEMHDVWPVAQNNAEHDQKVTKKTFILCCQRKVRCLFGWHRTRNGLYNSRFTSGKVIHG